MALSYQNEEKVVKFGAAADLKYGVDTNDDWDIVESVSVTQTYEREMQVKNEVGSTVGIVNGDPKLDITMSGYNNGSPVSLGALVDLKTTLDAVGALEVPTEAGVEKKFCIKSVREDMSNEDFVKYEIQGSHYYGVNYDDTEEIDSATNDWT